MRGLGYWCSVKLNGRHQLQLASKELIDAQGMINNLQRG